MGLGSMSDSPFGGAIWLVGATEEGFFPLGGGGKRRPPVPWAFGFSLFWSPSLP